MMALKTIQNKSLYKWVGLASIAVILFTTVFFISQSTDGQVPPMPSVSMDITQISFAEQRLQKRAASLTLSEYHNALQAAYEAFNLAEAKPQTPETIDRLRRRFVEKTEIAQTGNRERYLLMGDYLAKEFDTALTTVLSDIQQKGIQQAMNAQSPAYQKLVRLSGNFLRESIRLGMVRPDGKLQVSSYVPQILFRKRWRVLGDLPFRYQFLEIESLVDDAYQLQFGNHKNIEKRQQAVKRIRKAVPDFNHYLASALVYYDGGESEKAREVIKQGLSRQPDDFAMNQFLLFLTNDKRQ